METAQEIITIARRAKEAARSVASLSTEQKNRVLRGVSRKLAEQRTALQTEK